jgi:hypothetical protein
MVEAGQILARTDTAELRRAWRRRRPISHGPRRTSPRRGPRSPNARAS